MSVKFLRLINPKSPITGFFRRYSEGLPENLRRNYEKFQKDDGVPVYLKGGFGDRILLGFTVIVIAVGLEESARAIIRLDKKK